MKLRVLAAALACAVLSHAPALAQTTLLPPGQQCFQATSGLNGMVGTLGTVTGGSGGTAGTYGGVALTGGSGTGATANITVSAGAVSAVTILNPGTQYVVGDVLSAAAGTIGGATGFSVPVNSVTINSSLAGGTAAYYLPNTLTFKTTWKNSTQTTPNTNPVHLDQNGCAVVYGLGSYRQIVKDSLGNTVWDALTASTASLSTTAATSGSGDFMPIGSIQAVSGFHAPANYVFAFGQAISRTAFSDAYAALTILTTASCVSGSTTLAISDDVNQIRINSPVEGSCIAPGTAVAAIIGPGNIQLTIAATANATASVRILPWGNGDGSTTFNVPDLRGRVIAGADAMGGVAASRLTTTYYGTLPTPPGAPSLAPAGQSQTLTGANLPPYTPAGAIAQITPAGTVSKPTITVTQNGAGAAGNIITSSAGPAGLGGGGAGNITNLTAALDATPLFSGTPVTPAFTGTAQGGTSTPFSIIQPSMTVNYAIKIQNGTLPTIGVISLGGMTGDISCGSGVSCTGNAISAINGGSGVVQVWPIQNSLPNTLGNLTGFNALGGSLGCNFLLPGPCVQAAMDAAAPATGDIFNPAVGDQQRDLRVQLGWGGVATIDQRGYQNLNWQFTGLGFYTATLRSCEMCDIKFLSQVDLVTFNPNDAGAPGGDSLFQIVDSSYEFTTVFKLVFAKTSITNSDIKIKEFNASNPALTYGWDMPTPTAGNGNFTGVNTTILHAHSDTGGGLTTYFRIGDSAPVGVFFGLNYYNLHIDNSGRDGTQSGFVSYASNDIIELRARGFTSNKDIQWKSGAQGNIALLQSTESTAVTDDNSTASTNTVIQGGQEITFGGIPYTRRLASVTANGLPYFKTADNGVGVVLTASSAPTDGQVLAGVTGTNPALKSPSQLLDYLGSTDGQWLARGSSTWSATQSPLLGGSGVSASIGMRGLTSGTVTLKVQDVSGTFNFNLPITAGTSGQALVSGGGGSAAMTWADVITASSTTTFTNKTFDTAGAGNVFKINGTTVSGVTGTGSTAVLQNTPTLTTPVLGVATATSVNKVTITAPATSAVLTIPDGVTLTGPAASGTAMTLGNNESVSGVKTFGLDKLLATAGNSASTVKPGGLLTAQLTSTGTPASTAETTLQTYDLPANAFNANGRGAKITAWGSYGANANTKNVRVYFGAQISGTGAVVQNATRWIYEVWVYRTGSAAQTYYARASAATAFLASDEGTAAQTDSAAITIKVTGINGAATANDIVCDGMTVEMVN